MEQFNKHPAQEYACLYVAVTRAKRNLTLVDPQGTLGYNWASYL